MNRREVLFAAGGAALVGFEARAEGEYYGPSVVEMIKADQADKLYWDAQMLICDLEEMYCRYKEASPETENWTIGKILDVLHAIPRPS